MELKQLIKRNRSYRRFNTKIRVEDHDLLELVDLARLSASAGNLQSLKYIISNEKPQNEKVFECLKWAGYLNNWEGPVAEERPSAYIVIVKDTAIAKNHFCDDGIAAQSILLGAVEKGLGGCMIGAINRPNLQKVLMISDQYEILMVLALGKPVEEVVLETMKEGNCKYYRDEYSVHHVPKRALNEIIIDVNY